MQLMNRILLKLEHDTTVTDQKIGYEEARARFFFGVDFLAHKNFQLEFHLKEAILYFYKIFL